MKMDGRLQPGQVGAVLAEDDFLAFDDTTGQPLDYSMVKDARDEEMQEVRKHNLYTKV